MLKRIFDVSLALVGLFFTLPMLVLVALAVKLESPGPIFFARATWERWKSLSHPQIPQVSRRVDQRGGRRHAFW